MRRIQYVYLAAGVLGMVMAGQSLTSVRAQGVPVEEQVLHLTRKQAIQEALEHNPGIVIARELVIEAKAQIAIATAIPDPMLVTELDQVKNLWSLRSSTEHDVGVQFVVPYPYRTHLNGNIARAGWKEAEYSLTQLRQQIAAQTSEAYDAFLVARRHRDDLTQSKDIAAQFLEKSQARFKGGTVPKLDTIKAQVDLSKAENDLIANEKLIDTSVATLNRLMGRPLRSGVDAIDLLEVPGNFPELYMLEQVALRSRPELMSMTEQQKAAHDSTTVNKEYWIPDLNFTIWRSYIDGAPELYRLDGGITVPIFFWQHEKGAVTQAVHHELELKATGTDLRAQVLLDVNTSYATAVTAFRQAVFLRDSLLPEAREAFQDTFTSYGLGGSSALDLLDAKSTLVGAESDYTDALGAVNDAAADLERAIGAPLPPANNKVQ